MSYAIYLTDGTLFATIPDGTINQQSSVTLIGQNYIGYGVLQDTNFIQMLENFSSTTAPTNPLTGQLWFNLNTKLLSVYSGSGIGWVNVGAYGNANVASFLSNFGSNNISTTGTVTAGNLSAANNIFASGNASVAGNISVSNNASISGNAFISGNASVTNNVSVANNVSAVGNIIGSYILGDGYYLSNINSGNITSAYGNANVAAYLPTYSGSFTASTVSVTGNITGSYILGNGSQLTGLPATYSNSNVSAYLATFSGPISATNISASGNVLATNVSASGNIIGNSLFVYGSGNILGNLNVQGNITFIDSNVIVTNDLFIDLANNQSTFANINGSGLHAGNTGSATLTNWTYSASANAWSTNVGVSATGTVTGGNVVTSGLVSAGGNVTGGNVVTSGLVSAGGNVIGNYLIGNGSQITGLPAGYSNATAASFLANFGSNTISTSGGITGGNITGGNINMTGGFSIRQSGSKLYFYYNSTAILSLDSTGNLIALANMTGYETP